MKSNILLILQLVLLQLALVCAAETALQQSYKWIDGDVSGLRASRTVRSNSDTSHTQSPTAGFNVEYTILRADSPDCDPSLADNFPVQVQYRMAARANTGGGNEATFSEWMVSPIAPTEMPAGKTTCFDMPTVDG